MTAALIAACLAQPATVAAFVWLLRHKDQAERAERSVLLNRIQDPPAAVAQTLDPTPPEPEVDWDELTLEMKADGRLDTEP